MLCKLSISKFDPIIESFFSISPCVAFGSNSNSFEEDDFYIHLREFFGFNPKDSTKKINYPDLSIKNDSKNLRELYEAKLNQMTSNNYEQPYNIEAFFKEKI